MMSMRLMDPFGLKGTNIERASPPLEEAQLFTLTRPLAAVGAGPLPKVVDPWQEAALLWQAALPS